MASSSSVSAGNLPSEISTKPLKDINILLLGEIGVGKSTWINGIANYLTYGNLAEAIENEVVVLIPSQFTMINDKYEQITVSIGASDPNEVHVTGQSATQYPHTYCFKTAELNIRIIDTPGIGDIRGVDQDKANFEYIMDHLSYFDVIHGICILLKPNSAGFGVHFRFCMQEILMQLHRDAAQNIFFCFTNARSTYYRPGDTLTFLRDLLTETKALSTQIPLEKKTIYCVDNEAFRFLAGVKAGQNFEESEQANFSKSWETSVKETARLLNYIQGLKPHHTTNTVTLNATRQTIIKLAKPLVDVSHNIQTNILFIEDKQKELATVDSLGKNEAIAKYGKFKCDLQYEQTVINRTTAKYAVFLKENSITPINNITTSYVDYLIELEKAKVHAGGEKSVLGKLQKLKHAYTQEEQILLECLVTTPQEGHVSLDAIEKSREELFSLPINGNDIRRVLDTAKSDKMCHRETVFEAPLPKRKGGNESYGLGAFMNSAADAVTNAIKKLGR